MAVIPERVAESDLTKTLAPLLNRTNQGKVRDTFSLPGGNLLVVATDRLSIFDFVLPAIVTDKGHILTALTIHWLTKVLTDTPNHLIAFGTNIDAYLPPRLRHNPHLMKRALVVKQQKMVPIECIVRGYLTGSGWRSYKKNGTVCGIQLPKGLHDGSQLPEDLFTPSTKATTGHDENISFKQMVEIVSLKTAEKLRQQSLEIFRRGSIHALKQGVILADTKLEWGAGVLADEVLTPDSSRYWDKDEWKTAAAKQKSPPPHDKELVRNWGKNIEHPFPELDPGLGSLDPENLNHLSFVNQLTVPQNILGQTTNTYHNIFQRLTNQSLDNFTHDVMQVNTR